MQFKFATNIGISYSVFYRFRNQLSVINCIRVVSLALLLLILFISNIATVQAFHLSTSWRRYSSSTLRTGRQRIVEWRKRASNTSNSWRKEKSSFASRHQLRLVNKKRISSAGNACCEDQANNSCFIVHRHIRQLIGIGTPLLASYLQEMSAEDEAIHNVPVTEGMKGTETLLPPPMSGSDADILYDRLKYQYNMSNFQIVQNYGLDRSPSSSSSSPSVVVKTLVWTAYSSPTSRDDEEQQDHYFVTVLRQDNRVKERKLLQYIQQIVQYQTSVQGGEHRRITSVRLADEEMAESLTGFKLGTIPPIGHTFPLRIFVDADLVTVDPTSNHPWLQVAGGSGSTDYSLVISIDEILRYGSIRWTHTDQRGEFIDTNDVLVCALSSWSSLSFVSSPGMGEVDDSTATESYNIAVKDGPRPMDNDTSAPRAVNLDEALWSKLKRQIGERAMKKNRTDDVLRIIEQVGDKFPMVRLVMCLFLSFAPT